MSRRTTMRRRLPALAVVLLALLGATPAAGQEPAGQEPTGTTRVDVEVRHAAGRPVADVPVTLEVHDGRQTLTTLEGRTDAEGRLTWEEVPAATGYHARATATWNGVRYPGDTVTLSAGEPVRLTVDVFETTEQGRPLHLDTLHLILQAEEPGLLRVLQFMTVTNTADAAYAGGPELADGRRAGVVVPLPAGATQLASAPFPTAEESLVLSEAEVAPGRILDPRPVPPGGRQVAVTYDIIVDDGGAELAFELPYPTASVSVLLGGPAADGLEVESSDLESRPAEQIGDQQFDLWVAEARQPGDTVSLTVGRGGVQITVQQWAILAVSLGLLLAVAGTWLGRGGGGRTAADREEILRRIAELDLRHDAGELEAGEYFQRRGRELERLAVLERLTGDRGGADAGSDGA